MTHPQPSFRGPHAPSRPRHRRHVRRTWRDLPRAARRFDRAIWAREPHVIVDLLVHAVVAAGFVLLLVLVAVGVFAR